MGNKLSSKRKSSSATPTPRSASTTTTATSSKQEGTIDESQQHTVSNNSSVRRRIHQISNSTYWFPNDDEEMDRLIGQHFALKTFLEGNVVAKGIPLIPTPFDEGAKVLDLACGPGTWIMDFATENPNAQCVGVDMVDVFPKEIRPTNVEFKVANVMEGLPYPDNSFDLVYPGGCAQSVEAGMLEKGNEFVNKAGQASKQDQLTREFIHDICCIFTGAEPILSKALNIPSEEWPAFVKELGIEMKKQPDAMWSYGVCFAQKPVEEPST
ncbi:S-adenosyl-L-methionine-dependent methyltransferase [Zychaea mexicana]|uniref:S-adenosyl-L-methionine-dependent methyltransferase n=1 Tax=Zychaea mexicana TaxID=64656 RepID=UPI0022FE5D80|nr:S-adenosyl-L-methionine-dependent methyltransferase [Zychaea mexicana]KAI9499484.1 S-adenosyl-L-methionine-dependent methyltransferase [Zychaea mexicana]